MSEATILVERCGARRPPGRDKLLELVYEELRRLATSKMAREASGHTLQPTDWCMKRGCDCGRQESKI